MLNWAKMAKHRISTVLGAISVNPSGITIVADPMDCLRGLRHPVGARFCHSGAQRWPFRAVSPTPSPIQGVLGPETMLWPYLGHGSNCNPEGPYLGCNPHFEVVSTPWVGQTHPQTQIVAPVCGLWECAIQHPLRDAVPTQAIPVGHLCDLPPHQSPSFSPVSN